MLYASCMHGGNHAANDLPVALLGSGGGVFKSDQNVLFDAELPLRDLHFTILNSYFVLGATSLGASTKNVPNQLVQQILV